MLGSSPVQVKQLMWKCLSCTLRTSPEHILPHMWHRMTGGREGEGRGGDGSGRRRKEKREEGGMGVDAECGVHTGLHSNEEMPVNECVPCVLRKVCRHTTLHTQDHLAVPTLSSDSLRTLSVTPMPSALHSAVTAQLYSLAHRVNRQVQCKGRIQHFARVCVVCVCVHACMHAHYT